MNMFASWNSNQGYMYSCQVSWNMRQYVTADACFTLSLPESEQIPGLRIFPNPARIRTSINIETNKGIEHIQVISAAGRTISESNQGPIEIHQPGVYFLMISLKDGTRQSAKVLITDW
ncbi:MAG: T9SS type A sorting domain-containing protein [Schleiferiaceae bacterium]|nr:T9SS type A sorting domain-containing protein [Schleiferiaceae bacterium]